jgi:hypothetical protein
MLAVPDLFDLTHFAHRSLFAGTTFAWEVLPHLEAYIRDQFATRLRPAVQTMLPPGAFIVGDGCVVGHATEVKQSVLLNHAHAPHFAFIFPQEFMH